MTSDIIFSSAGGIGGGIAGGAIAGTAIAPGLGTAIGAIIGAIAGSAAGSGGTKIIAAKENDYARVRWASMGVAGTDRGKDVVKEYLETIGVDYNSAKIDFKGDKVKINDGENDITYERLAEFETDLEIEKNKDKLFDIINATNELTWERANKTEKVLSSYFENGNLSLLDPELLEEAENLNKEQLEDYVEQNQEVLQTALN